MEQIDSSLIAEIIVTLLFSAFFSGMEIAFVSGNRMMLEMDKDRLGIRKKIIDIFYAHSNNFVSTLLVGNNIALVIYGILIAKLFDNTIFRNGCRLYRTGRYNNLNSYSAFYGRVPSKGNIKE